MESFYFTPEDIKANQQGVLSQNQIENLKEHIFFSFDKNFKITLAFFAFAIVYLLMSGTPVESFFWGVLLLSIYPLIGFINLF